jgi:hypothetical protein
LHLNFFRKNEKDLWVSGKSDARKLKLVKMKNLLKIGLLLSFAYGWSSCGTYYSYTLKNPDHVKQKLGFTEDKMPFILPTFDAISPGFTRKGQFFIANDVKNGFSMSSAYALTEKSYVMVIGGFSDRYDEQSGYETVDLEYTVHYNDLIDTWTENFDTTGAVKFAKSTEFRSRFIEIGYGKFKKIGKCFSNDWLGGMGWGRANIQYDLATQVNLNYQDNAVNDYNFYDHSESRKFWHFYFQDCIHWINDNLEVSVLGRANSFVFTNRDIKSDFPAGTNEYDKLAFSLETAVRMAIGGKRFKLFAEYNGALPVLSPEFDRYQQRFRFGVFTRFGGE